MPVQDVNLIDGPHIQADGRHRGEVEVIFDSGRVKNKHIEVVDAEAWAQILVDIGAIVESETQQEDAEGAVDPDNDFESGAGEASIVHVACAYIKAALGEDRPDAAFNLLVRINNYKNATGLPWSTVEAALVDPDDPAHITQDQYDTMRAAYNRWSSGNRASAFIVYQDEVEWWADNH